MDITVHTPGHLELVNPQEKDAKMIQGNGWTMKRKHPKIGRNQICPCGSGLKFKNCKHENYKK